MYTQVKVVWNRLGIDGTTDIMTTAFRTRHYHKTLLHDTLPWCINIIQRTTGLPGTSSIIITHTSLVFNTVSLITWSPRSAITTNQIDFSVPTTSYPVINIQGKANSSICSKAQNFESQFHSLISLHHSISSSHLLLHRNRSPFQSSIRHSKYLSQLTQQCYKSPFQSPIQHSHPLYQPAHHHSKSPFQSPIHHSHPSSQHAQHHNESPFQSPIQHSNPSSQPA